VSDTITSLLRIILARQIKPFVFENKKNYKINYDQKNLGIYVHIPFCKKICDFCPYSKIIYEKNIAQDYFKALIKEIEIKGKNFNSKKEVTSVYFGGGSPALAGEFLKEILNKIKEYFIIKENIGIELHPENINEENLKIIKNAGFDMVSIGIQSFNKKSLENLGRNHMNSQALIKQVQKHNFKSIDIDLIFGIPNQTAEDLKNDFVTAVKNGATQISTYPFIDFSYAKNKNKPQGKKEKKKMLDMLSSISKDFGFERQSIWTFKKTGTPTYSSITRDNFIGFGASATTLLKDVFFIKTFSVNEYIKSLEKEEIPISLTMNFNERTRTLYWLFWSCYNIQIDKNNFFELFDKEIEILFSFELKLANKLKLIQKNGKGYSLTDKGIYYFHEIEQKYTHQYIDKTWKIAQKQAYPKKINLY
jgi:oxygen-independent coproporphyrinogen-3 oxidase